MMSICFVGVFCLLVAVTALPADNDFIKNRDQTLNKGKSTTKSYNTGENHKGEIIIFPKESELYPIDPSIIAKLMAAEESIPQKQEAADQTQEEENSEKSKETKLQGQDALEEKPEDKNLVELINPKSGEEEKHFRQSDLIANNNQVSSNEIWNTELKPSIIEFIKMIEKSLPEGLVESDKNQDEQNSEEANDNKPKGRKVFDRKLEDQTSKEGENRSNLLNFIANNGKVISKDDKNDREKEIIPEAPELPPLENSIIEFIKDTENRKPKEQETDVNNKDEQNFKEPEESKHQGSNDNEQNSEEKNPEYLAKPESMEQVNNSESPAVIASNDKISSNEIPTKSVSKEDNDEDQKVVIPEAPELPPLDPSIIEFIKENEKRKHKDQETDVNNKDEQNYKEPEESKHQGSNVNEQNSEEKNPEYLAKPESGEQVNNPESPDGLTNNDKISSNEIPTKSESKEENHEDQNVVIPEAPELPPLDPSIIQFIKENEKLQPKEQETVDNNKEEQNSKEHEESKLQGSNVDEQKSGEGNPEYLAKPESAEPVSVSELPDVNGNNDKILNNEISTKPESKEDKDEGQKVVISEAPELPPLDPSVLEFIKEESALQGQETVEQKLPEQNFGVLEIPEREEENEESNYVQLVDAPFERIPEINEVEENPLVINTPKPSFLSSLFSYFPSLPFSFSHFPSFSYNWRPSFMRSPSESYRRILY